MSILRIIAIAAALVGLADSIYLTVHHYTAEPVPCSLIDGCETVLTSPYAEIAGVPLAVLGAAAYFAAFSLALLAIFGNRTAWTLFGVQAVVMAIFTSWLIYLQAAVIGAFCQFCLLSAITTYILLTAYIISLLVRQKNPV
ncbi:MAG: vitamin K epoxide reductase family protein [Saprospiraceae bacterium]|nr:vitamin K epoxide reductase family protein [Pyrinomonadaceae bacterium]